MHSRTPSPTSWLTLALAAAASLGAHASTLDAGLTSQFLVRGEQAMLEFVVSDGVDPGASIQLPSIPGLTLNPVGFGAQPRLGENRRREYVYRFLISGYEPDTYTIPAAELETANGILTSDPIQLIIFNETELEWSKLTIGGREIPYAAAFHVLKSTPFVNEVIPTELKLYFPADQRIEDFGIPEFQRDGVAAWRFQPRPTVGRANLLARSYYSVSYPSSLSATRTGPVTLGPADLRLISVQSSLDTFGNANFVPLNLTVPALNLEARPLPSGAPEGFEDAIGRFSLSVTSSESEVREGDPVNITLIVSGTGNLETLNVPTPLDADGWKLYPATPLQRGDDRRQISGFNAFRQFMRPLRPQSQIPPFRLVYFDPTSETYETLISNPIPLTVLPSTGPSALGAAIPPALSMPVEEMTDILGLIQPAQLLLPDRRSLPPWWWQLIPAALVAFLLARIAREHIAPRLRKDPDEIARLRDLRELDRAPSDVRGFYRAAGHFVERWLGSSADEIPREVLARRDEVCFRSESADQQVPRGDRQRILRSLRRLSLPLLALLLALAPPTARAEAATEASVDSPVEAYESGRYEDAASLWLESGPFERLTADTLYNIGNAAYRTGSPGEAALYWRRALHLDPTHAEARQNLRFFERKFGSITIKRPDHQYLLAKLSPETWRTLIWSALWLVAIALLIFPATRRDSGFRVAAISALVLAPLLAAAGLAGTWYYPNDAQFAPAAEQAVVISDRATVRTDAARNAPEVIVAPAGSLCRVLNQSGNWSYVAFTNETRGWIPSAEIQALIPSSTPEPPKRREPLDDQKSA